jgi:hypothetical protein
MHAACTQSHRTSQFHAVLKWTSSRKALGMLLVKEQNLSQHDKVCAGWMVCTDLLPGCVILRWEGGDAMIEYAMIE